MAEIARTEQTARVYCSQERSRRTQVWCCWMRETNINGNASGGGCGVRERSGLLTRGCLFVVQRAVVSSGTTVSLQVGNAHRRLNSPRRVAARSVAVNVGFSHPTTPDLCSSASFLAAINSCCLLSARYFRHSVQAVQ